MTTKLGVFCQVDPGDLAQRVIASGCRFVVVMDNPGLAATTLKGSPHAVVVYRAYNLETDPGGTAQDWAQWHVNQLAPVLSALRGCDFSRLYFTGPIYDGGDPTDREIAMEAERARLGDQLGFKTCAFNFGVGNPRPECYEAMLPAFRALNAGRHMFGAHEYFGKDPYDLYYPALGYGDLCFRYRRVRQFCEAHGLIDFVMGLTETGADWLPQVLGSARGYSLTMSYEEYQPKLVTMAAEWERDPYMLGGAVFIDGCYDQWRAFQVKRDPFYAMIAAASAAQEGTVVDTAKAVRDAAGVVQSDMTKFALALDAWLLEQNGGGDAPVGGTPAQKQYAVTASNGLRVRSAPSAGAAQVGKMAYGDTFATTGAEMVVADGYYWLKISDTQWCAYGKTDGSETYVKAL